MHSCHSPGYGEKHALYDGVFKSNIWWVSHAWGRTVGFVWSIEAKLVLDLGKRTEVMKGKRGKPGKVR